MVAVVEARQQQELGVSLATRTLYQQVPLPRSAFDDTNGAVLVGQAATPAARAELEPCGAGTYLAYAAAGALLQLVAAPSASLRVYWGGSQDHMLIDAASVQALEVIQPLRVGTCRQKGGASLLRCVGTLCCPPWEIPWPGCGRDPATCPPLPPPRLLDGTQTKAGARLLRATLLRPLRDVATLNARYDCVEELAAAEDVLLDVSAGLKQLPQDLDRCTLRVLCSTHLAQQPCRSAGVALGPA